MNYKLQDNINIEIEKQIDYQVVQEPKLGNIIRFKDNLNIYEIIDNQYMGPRLMIIPLNSISYLLDAPFNKNTSKFLPSFIKVTFGSI